MNERMTKIDRQNLRILADAVHEALKPVAEKYGIDILPGNGVYGDVEGSTKIIFKVRADADGRSADEATFRKYAAMVGLKADDFGKTFSMGGRSYKICALKITGALRPIIAERDGKRFAFTAADVLKLLGN